MRWLASLSTSRALAIALLWPATLIIVPIVALRLWTFWSARRDDTLLHAEFVFVGDSSEWLLAVLLIPPIAFLVAWIAARRGNGVKNTVK